MKARWLTLVRTVAICTAKQGVYPRRRLPQILRHPVCSAHLGTPAALAGACPTWQLHWAAASCCTHTAPARTTLQGEQTLCQQQQDACACSMDAEPSSSTRVPWGDASSACGGSPRSRHRLSIRGLPAACQMTQGSWLPTQHAPGPRSRSASPRSAPPSACQPPHRPLAVTDSLQATNSRDPACTQAPPWWWQQPPA